MFKKMAVKLSIFTVILISCVWLVLSMPVAQVLEESKTVFDIVRDEYNDFAFFPRLKKSVVVVGTCPKGMQFYNNQCLTPEEIKRLEEEDYDDDVSTAGTTKDITKDGSTQEHLPESVTVATDFTTYTKSPLNVNDWSNTETEYNDNTVRHTADPSSDDNVNQLELKDKTTVTENYSSSTERNYDENAEAGATVTRTDDADKNRLNWREFNELTVTAFSVCCCIGLFWCFSKYLYCVVFKLLDCYFIPSSTTSSSSSLDIRCQRDLRRNEVESSHSLLPSHIAYNDATSMDPILSLQ